MVQEFSRESNVLHLQERMLPQNIDAECAVLGGCLLDPNAIERVISTLTADAFYLSAHRELYRCMADLHMSSQPCDLMNVYTWLDDRSLIEKIGGKGKLTQLLDSSVSAVNIDQYADLIVDKYRRRLLIHVGNEIAAMGADTTTPLPMLFDNAEQRLFATTQSNTGITVSKVQDIVLPVYQDIENRFEGLTLPGISCGFYDLDAMTQGFQRSDLIIVAGRPSMGKCLGKGTKVLMFDGTTKVVEDVVVGDLLMGDDSTPRTVLSLARGREMMYWVRQNRGIDYRVNESHILSLKGSRNEVDRRNGDVLNISVREYLGKSAKFKSNYKGYKVPVDFPAQSVDVDPYFLGLWLGDGSSANVVISNPDAEVLAYLETYASKLALSVHSRYAPGKCPSHAITKVMGSGSTTVCLQTKLRQIEVLNDKHIPQIYLANSRENRLQLLAGLLDTDGYYDRRLNIFEITQKSQRLAQQIKWLCDSLGFSASFVAKTGSIASTGFSDTYYRVRLAGDLDSIPTRIKRKQARKLQSGRNWRVTGITVEPDCVDDYYGFTLDGNSLFLLEDMTVTHNTAFTLNIARNVSAFHNLPTLVFSLEMSKERLVQRLLSGESRIESGRLLAGKITQNEWEPLGHAVAKVSSLPLFIDDQPAATVAHMKATARRIQAEHGRLGLIMIDYLQLMGGIEDNRSQELSKITMALKTLARELDVPVIALSQLSRGVESRTNKRPMMSDLRESGAIEQDADLILMLYRDEYYNPETPDRGIAEIIITKHRNGPTGTVKLLFENQFTQFRNLATPKRAYD